MQYWKILYMFLFDDKIFAAAEKWDGVFLYIYLN